MSVRRVGVDVIGRAFHQVDIHRNALVGVIEGPAIIRIRIDRHAIEIEIDGSVLLRGDLHAMLIQVAHHDHVFIDLIGRLGSFFGENAGINARESGNRRHTASFGGIHR